MRGHVRKRGKMWAVVVDVGRDANGKRKQKWHSGFKRRKEADDALAKILGQVGTGTYVESSKLTVQGFLQDEWLPAMKPSLRASTFESYAMIVEQRIVPAVGSERLQQLNAARLNTLYASLLEGDNDRRPLSARSVRYTHAVLRHALADAVKWNRLAHNVADSAEPPSARAAKAKTMATWDRDQLRRFLAAVADDRLAALWRLAAMTGMRRGELLGLTWADIDLDAGRARITEAKTDAGRRSVALDPETVAALRAHRKAQAAERLALGPAYTDTDRVFCQADGSELWAQSVSRTFQRLSKRAELPVIRFHDLRHTHATLALQADVHPEVVRERLGHSSIAITLDVYSHAVPAMQEDAATTVAALID